MNDWPRIGSQLCSRVVVSSEGEAVPARRALERGIVPTRMWVRKDGWTLGAPSSFHAVARSMWADEWEREVDLLSEEAVKRELSLRLGGAS